MALVTRCRNCGTTYKIYPEQLQAQNGFVRCGACRAVFNGFATLITVDESGIEYAPVADNKDSSLVTPGESGEAAEEIAALRENLCHEPEPAPDDVQGAILSVTADETAVLTDPLPAASDLESPESPEKPVIKPAIDFLADKEPSRSREYRTWQAASIFLCVLLAGQGIYAYRTELTVLFPQSRSFLEKLCGPLGCSVPLPAHIQQLSIVHSDLEVRDPAHFPEVLTLTTIIRNHAVHAQALPAIKLSLTDVHNQLLASRVFTAEEYLSGEQKAITAIQRGQELVIELYLDNSDLKSTGYQVRLMYL
ncbi:MAG: zinc-ribbon domain-containing protein [Nitrosomonas sp.]|nr:zinc-ribbon domain-containing protein [Nitrosomonas sp.]